MIVYLSMHTYKHAMHATHTHTHTRARPLRQTCLCVKVTVCRPVAMKERTESVPRSPMAAASGAATLFGVMLQYLLATTMPLISALRATSTT